MSIKFRVLGGGVFWVLGGGGECRFYFYGRGDFSDKMRFAKRGSVRERCQQVLNPTPLNPHPEKSVLPKSDPKKMQALFLPFFSKSLHL